MKGIILAGGDGTRLRPLTIAFSKQLIPVFDKPLIYYPICTLMNMGIKKILIIVKSNQKNNFYNLLKNGQEFGISIEYEIQDRPNGIAESLLIGSKFIKNSPITLILGDNIFYSEDLKNKINNFYKKNKSHIFLYKVKNPKDYGVVSFVNNKISLIKEKPKKPLSNYAVTGLYIYDNNAIKYAQDLKPSSRGELEITDLNNIYIKNKAMNYTVLKNSSVWFDAGTPSSLLYASQYIQAVQERNNILISSPEEIAYKMKFINKVDLTKLLKKMPKNKYFNTLRELL
tara:strand:+ start:485 stop:1339 length:855 start_codon:yes stop_codon:yes gene_type:complete